MKPESIDTEARALAFFGRVTAGVSHEIKNALAIINENAGLLEDLTLMAEEGRPLDPGRVAKVAENLAGQVRRADAMVKEMNAFAHSVDHPVKRVDLGAVASRMAALAGRMAAGRRVTLQPSLPAEAIMVTTCEFKLQNLIWLCIALLVEAAEAPGTLRLTPETDGGAATLRIISPAGDVAPGEKALAESRAGELAEALGGEIRWDAAKGEFLLVIPHSPSSE